MTQSTRAALRRALTSGYARLRRRLTFKLGSESLASEVLHETWLRLGEGGELEPVSNPEAYVYRAAMNTAHNLRVSAGRAPPLLELDEAFDVADDAAGPDRTVESQDQVRALAAAVAELSPRQQDVFHACFLGGVPTEEVAARHGVSVRTIQADLRLVVVHCARRLGRKELLADRTFRVSRN